MIGSRFAVRQVKDWRLRSLYFPRMGVWGREGHPGISIQEEGGIVDFSRQSIAATKGR